MGMFHKGAQLDWLSQYPDEAEFLYSPLTGIEVICAAVVMPIISTRTSTHPRTRRYRVSVNSPWFAGIQLFRIIQST